MNKYLDKYSVDMVLINGNIITIDSLNPRVQALAVSEGKIIKLGSNSEIRQLITSNTEVIDLEGKPVLPGFFESHTHLLECGDALQQIDCKASSNNSINDILEKVKKEASLKPEGEWIKGYGYDESSLLEKRPPTRWELDKVAPNHPVILNHISLHSAVANTCALKLVGINNETNEKGILRDPKTSEITGVLVGIPAVKRVADLLPHPTLKDLKIAIIKAQEEYLKKGVTSISEAGVGYDYGAIEFDAFNEVDLEGKLKLRTNLMIYDSLFQEMMKEKPENLGVVTGSKKGNIRIDAVKLYQDGSIQGGSGALLEPYYYDENKKGSLLFSQEEMERKIGEAHKAGFQVAIHANGDAAIESVIDAYESVLKKNPRLNHRHRIEHCQMVTDSQLDRMRDLGIIASFFVYHVYNWGDGHKNTFIGPERASRIDPLNSAAKRNIIFGLHNDTPVTDINPLISIWTAVNRKTKAGEILGKDQRISVEEALKSMTIDSAYLSFEENIKGSLAYGKLADMVVLSEDPTAIDMDEIKDIKVEMTIVGGKVVYKS